MMKNIVIGALSLAVIILSWLALYETPVDRTALSQVKDKIDATREQIQAYKTNGREAGLGGENPLVGNTSRGDTAADETPAIQNENDPNNKQRVHGERQPVPSAAAILGTRHPQKRTSDPLSSEELSAILAVLKSAQDLLRKTACATPEHSQGDGSPEGESPQATEEVPQAAVIKKKLSTGLTESE